MLRILQKIFNPKTLNHLSNLRNFSRHKTEYIPCVDRSVVYILYRFSFFRNRFLRRARPQFSRKDTKSRFSDFNFSEEELARFEQTGITPVFRFSGDAISTIIKSLDEHSVSMNGKRIKRSVESFRNANPQVEDLAGLYAYNNISKNQKLIEIGTDPALIQFVSRYLRLEDFTLDIMAFWSFPNKEPIGNQKDGKYDNAQNYHSDHTNRRCLKLFVYLTDCDFDNGPHSYIKGSHINRPLALQLKLPRLTGEELEAYYPKDDSWLILTGQAGNAFITDPFGTHRGLEPVKGSRLLIQFMYSIDNFRQTNYGIHLNASEVLNEYEEVF